MTYKYFLAALNHWIEKTGRGYQKILALETGKTKGYISQLLSPKRKKPISFELQNDLAEACGYSYEDFLMLGKRILENNSHAESTSEKKADEKETRSKPPVGNVIRVYNNILERTGIELDAEGQEKLFNLIRRKLEENAAKEVENEFLDIASIWNQKAK